METDYFAIKALSNSALKLWKRSKAEYHLKHIVGEDFEEDKDAFRLGSFVHCLALEPHKIDSHWEIAVPPLNKTTKEPLKSGKVYSEWLASYKPSEGKQWITRSEWDEGTNLVQGLRSHPMIATLLDDLDRLNEHEITKSMSVRSQSGVDMFSINMKCKIDLIIPKRGLIVDIKTGQSELPGDFRQEVFQRKYHWQSYIYRSLACAEFGGDFRFLFAVVNKSNYKASLLELPEWLDQIAAKEVDETLQKFNDWIESRDNPGDWRTGVCKCD